MIILLDHHQFNMEASSFEQKETRKGIERNIFGHHKALTKTSTSVLYQAYVYKYESKQDKPYQFTAKK